MDKKFLTAILILLIMLTINACKRTQPETTEEAISSVPPAESEIIQLSNGYQITLGMKEIIDKRCAAWGPEYIGGDTGQGYGCVKIPV